jgi:hypothetical protein
MITMKRWWISMALGAALLLPSAVSAEEYQPVGIEVDQGRLDVDGYLVEGRTMVPLRAIFERLNATMEWNETERSITATKGATVVKLTIGQTAATAGDRSVTLDVPPMLIHGSTYVPLRFVSEAMGAGVSFDNERQTAQVNTDSSCSQGGGQVHSGTIKPGGETWGVCGSPHFVKGTFWVEGKDSPILTIEAGAVVRFENGASLWIGENAPGGLVAEGTAEKPIVFTADTAGAQPGFWQGIQLRPQTLKGRATLVHTRIEYAGGTEGALRVQGGSTPITATVRQTEIKHSAYAGLLLRDGGRLSGESGELKITGTKTTPDGGGAPIVTDAYGSHALPLGDYKGNDLDTVLLSTNSSSTSVTTPTSWRSLGVPYTAEISVYVEGTANPTLTIEPGVQTVWAKDTGLYVGENERGGLVAEGTKEKPISFSSELERQGSWYGISLGAQAGGKNLKLQNVTLEYAQRGISMSEDLGPVVKDSVLRSNKEYGIFVNRSSDEVTTDFIKGLGNTFQNNGQDVGTQ